MKLTTGSLVRKRSRSRRGSRPDPRRLCKERREGPDGESRRRRRQSRREGHGGLERSGQVRQRGRRAKRRSRRRVGRAAAEKAKAGRRGDDRHGRRRRGEGRPRRPSPPPRARPRERRRRTPPRDATEGRRRRAAPPFSRCPRTIIPPFVRPRRGDRLLPRLSAPRGLARGGGRASAAPFPGTALLGAAGPRLRRPAARLLVVGLAPRRTGATARGGSSRAILGRLPLRRAAPAGLANQAALGLAERRPRAERRLHRGGRALRAAGQQAHAGGVRDLPPFLAREIAALPNLRVVLALGALAWRSALEALEENEVCDSASAPGVRARRGSRSGRVILLGSYHVSQQNTNTGRLTPAMFDAVLKRAKREMEEPRGELEFLER